MPIRKVNGFTLWDLWFFCPQTHVFVKADDSDLPWEYEGGPEGDQLYVSTIQAKAYPSYGEVIEVGVYRKDDES